MTSGLDSIALAVVHLEATGNTDRPASLLSSYAHASPYEESRRYGQEPHDHGMKPCVSSVFLPPPVPSRSSYAAPYGTVSADMMHRTLPDRMGYGSPFASPSSSFAAPRVVSADHSVIHRAQSCLHDEAGRIGNGQYRPLKAHSSIQYQDPRYADREEHDQNNISVVRRDSPSSHFAPSAVPSSFSSDYEDTIHETHTCTVPTSQGVASMASPDTLANNFDQGTSSASITETVEMLFTLDLRELKNLTGPEPNEAIPFVRQNDVLCGRGGETNHHSGNIQYRQFVKACQKAYIQAKRKDKPFIAKRVVLAVRKLGGCFLKKDHASNTWRDVGNAKAREKTSQALREGAPELRTGEPGDCSDSGDKKVLKRKSIDGTSPKKSQQRRKSAPAFAEPVVSRIEVPIPCQEYIEDAASQVPVVSPSKKRRVSLADLANAATSQHVLSPAFEEHKEYQDSSSFQKFVPVVAQVPVPSETFSFHHQASFTTTISADDGERSTSSPISHDGSHQETRRAKSAHGPRLKLLKKRLENETV